MKKLTKKAIVMMALMIAGTASAAYEDTVRKSEYCKVIADGASIIRMEVDANQTPNISEYVGNVGPNVGRFLQAMYEEVARSPRNTITPNAAFRAAWARCMDSIDEYVFRDRAASN